MCVSNRSRSPGAASGSARSRILSPHLPDATGSSLPRPYCKPRSTNQRSLVLCKVCFLPQHSPHGCTYASAMTYVIGAACVDVVDRSCVRECPADCIYEGSRSLYINPQECVDCGACK